MASSRTTAVASGPGWRRGATRTRSPDAASHLLPAALLAPSMLWIGFFFLLPLGLMSWRSIAESGVEPYVRILTSPMYSNVLWTSFKVAFATTIGCLVLGYPIAAILAATQGRLRMVMLAMIALPYWLDYIVRSYSWMIVLGRRGLLNDLLIWLGIIDTPVTLLYNFPAVVIGMVQILLPMMILILFGAMVRIDDRLMVAASIHGANRFRAFITVFFPLSLPGVYGASLLVFITALGFYITPALLGSPAETMISQTIMVLSSRLLDWPAASAAGVLLLAVTMVVVLVYNRFFSIDRLWGGR